MRLIVLMMPMYNDLPSFPSYAVQGTILLAFDYAIVTSYLMGCRVFTGSNCDSPLDVLSEYVSPTTFNCRVRVQYLPDTLPSGHP